MGKLISDNHWTIQEIRIAMEKLRQPAGDLERRQAQQQLIAVLPELTPLWGIYAHASFPKPLFRVTKVQAISTDAAHLIQSYSYPSPDKCTQGRANLDGCPVLYQSETTETALKEVECKPGEVVYLSEWKIENPRGARFAFFLNEQLDQGHPWLALKDKYTRENGQHLTDQSSWERIQALHQLYCQAFRSDDYSISAVIAHELLYQASEETVDVLVYPSQADDHEHVNLAIATPFADAHVRLWRVFKMKSSESKSAPPQILAVGNVRQGIVDWADA